MGFSATGNWDRDLEPPPHTHTGTPITNHLRAMCRANSRFEVYLGGLGFKMRLLLLGLVPVVAVAAAAALFCFWIFNIK